jgi:hypothetical protein
VIGFGIDEARNTKGKNVYVLKSKLFTCSTGTTKYAQLRALGIDMSEKYQRHGNLFACKGLEWRERPN